MSAKDIVSGILLMVKELYLLISNLYYVKL